MYTPDKLVENLKKNFMDYCYTNIKFDSSKNLITIPEYLIWIDEKFVEKMKDYKE